MKSFQQFVLYIPITTLWPGGTFFSSSFFPNGNVRFSFFLEMFMEMFMEKFMVMFMGMFMDVDSSG